MPSHYHCIPSHQITLHDRHVIASSHDVTAYHIASHHNPSHDTTHYHITSQNMTPHHMTWDLTTNHITWPTSQPTTWHHITSRHSTSHHPRGNKINHGQNTTHQTERLKPNAHKKFGLGAAMWVKLLNQVILEVVCCNCGWVSGPCMIYRSWPFASKKLSKELRSSMA